MRILRFAELEQLPASMFRYDNSIRYERISTPMWLDTASGRFTVEKPYQLVGYCDRMPDGLMYGREGQIGFMLFHPEYGNVWEHLPLFDEDEREAARFVVQESMV